MRPEVIAGPTLLKLRPAREIFFNESGPLGFETGSVFFCAAAKNEMSINKKQEVTDLIKIVLNSIINIS